ncbi:LCP family glycopolymer transferase [Tomitella biformata]|uniref:LCP family protein n=1 Tax=Tomitella biformata TaxID=630403 RepID=UPI0004AD44C8
MTGYAWYSVDSLRSNLATAAGLGLGGGEDGAIDILVVGIDSRTDAKGNQLSQEELDTLRAGEADSTSTDTIMLIRIPNDGSSATAVSIPRDAYVEIPDMGSGKINSAYGATRALTLDKLVAEGVDMASAEQQATKAGRQALIESVAGLTGITVDHFAEVGLLGFVLLTDSVGGVPVCLNNAVDEPLSGANFAAGEQTLNGPDALSFVRQRHDLPRGDLDRIVRQQVFLASLAQEVLSAKTLSNPAKISEFSSAIERSVVIDDGWDVIRFAQQLQNLSGGKVKFETIPVVDPAGFSPNGESIVVVDPLQVQGFFDQMIGREPSPEVAAAEAEASGPLDVTPSKVTVSVLNASDIGGLATTVASELESVGYGLGDVGNSDFSTPVSVSTVFTSPKDSASGRAVARALGNLEVRTDESLDAGSVNVVLSYDYIGPGTDYYTAPITDGTAAPAPASDPHPGAPTSLPGAPPPEPGTPGAEPITASGGGPTCVN